MENLNQVIKIYGCLTELTNFEFLEQLKEIPCLIILPDKILKPNSSLTGLNSKLRPVTYDDLKLLDTRLVHSDTKDSSFRSTKSAFQHNFLIVERKDTTSCTRNLIITNSKLEAEHQIISSDLSIIGDFIREFLSLLCQSQPLDSKDNSFDYCLQGSDLDSWVVLESVPDKPIEGNSTTNEPAKKLLTQKNLELAAKVLYFGIQFALQLKFGAHFSLATYLGHKLW